MTTRCMLIDCRSVSESQYVEILAGISENRCELARSYRNPSDAVMSAVAGYCMKLLEEKYRCSIVIEPESGKPFLSDGLHHFNISHSGGFVAVAWSDMPVGVDVQAVITDPLIADRILTHKEMDVYNAGVDPFFLTRMWTRKESYLKLTGYGLSADPRDLEVLDDDGIMSCPVCARICEKGNSDVLLCVCYLGDVCSVSEVDIGTFLSRGLC